MPWLTAKYQCLPLSLTPPLPSFCMSVCVCWAAKNKCNKIKLLNTLLRAAVSQSKSRRTERRRDDEGGGGKCQPKSLVSPSSDVVPFLVPSAFYISYNVCFFCKKTQQRAQHVYS